MNDHHSKEKILTKTQEENVLFIRLQFLDILGIPKNIVIPTKRLDDALTDGIPFDGSSIAGYATIEESDKIAKPNPDSFVILPETLEKRKTARLICDIYEPDGSRSPADTKYALERLMQQAKKQGFIFNTGPECEFFLFKKNGEKSTLTPNDSAGYFDLSHRDLAEGVRADISLTLEDVGIETHTLHHEVSDGQHEINFKYADAMTTAEHVTTLKYITKIIANKHNLHASFMPKPIFGLNGSGMHTHMSLLDQSGKNLFYDDQDEFHLSDLSKSFIAGLLKHIKEITGILNPTVNSYKRLVPGHEAPTYISWANRNRSALIRIPTGTKKGARCELRSPDLSGNPYLQFAVMIASGLSGINQHLSLQKPIEKNIYRLTNEQKKEFGIDRLPESLGHALAILQESELVEETLGSHIYENYLYVKKEQWEDYRKQVTPWEIKKYLSLI
ncbi:MAG TPA: type I glutamate--ammonia ligase [Candidatus Thermoplasmatota archaeon]|nr:type I glutamate--ammonia ligase [Candidatus Thermoplasmatota archaeon]